MSPVFQLFGRALARYLSKPSASYEPPATIAPAVLRRALQPCDVLLVEGNNRISTAIKYLTQSTWSHAALYVGEALAPGDPDPPVLIEADLLEGVRAVRLSEYERFHTRICRPVGLSGADCEMIVRGAIDSVGQTYDLKNVVDLARYLVPTPPVPVRLRRRMIALGSGEPTRAICSTLIARLFQSVKYPILPLVETLPAPRPGCDDCVQEILHIRHYSLFAPRDFDMSPYFAIIKPSIDGGFDYRDIVWGHHTEGAGPVQEGAAFPPPV